MEPEDEVCTRTRTWTICAQTNRCGAVRWGLLYRTALVRTVVRSVRVGRTRTTNGTLPLQTNNAKSTAYKTGKRLNVDKSAIKYDTWVFLKKIFEIAHAYTAMKVWRAPLTLGTNMGRMRWSQGKILSFLFSWSGSESIGINNLLQPHMCDAAKKKNLRTINVRVRWWRLTLHFCTAHSTSVCNTNPMHINITFLYGFHIFAIIYERF